MQGRLRHDLPQRAMCLGQKLREMRCLHQVACRIVAQGLRHVVQHVRTDDATRPPHFGDCGQGQGPVERQRGLVDHAEPLRITQDLARDQRLFQRVGRQCVMRNPARSGPKEHLSRLAFILQRREVAGHHRRFDCGDGGGEVLGFDHGPAPGSLLPCRIYDDVQHGFSGFRIDGLCDLGGNLDQIAAQRSCVPAGKGVTDLAMIHRQPVAHDAIDLGDHLHVGVFDAVVDGFHEVARARLAHPGGAGLAVMPGGDGCQDMRDAVPVLTFAARHDRGAEPRAFLAARNADAEKRQVARFVGAAVGIVKIRVAGVDDHVVRPQQGAQGLDLRVDGITGGHHQDDRARGLDSGDKVLKGLGRRDPGLQRACIRVKGLCLAGRPVPDGDIETLVRDIQGKGRAHGSQTDQSDFRGGHRCLLLDVSF